MASIHFRYHKDTALCQLTCKLFLTNERNHLHLHALEIL